MLTIEPPGRFNGLILEASGVFNGLTLEATREFLYFSFIIFKFLTC